MTYCRFLFALLIGLLGVAYPQSPPLSGEVAVEIRAEPIASFTIGGDSSNSFGELEFRGGLVLTSSNKSFGGISAIHVQRDGAHFIAVSDQSSWLRGRILYQDHRPVGIADSAMAPILDAPGKPASRIDSESIAENGGTLYVGIERTHRILRFNYGKKRFLAHGEDVVVPPEIKNLPNNQGLEGLVYVPKKLPLGGTLIALSERGLDNEGNIKSFLIGGSSPGVFTIKRTDDFDISDAALLPRGDLLVLERKYSMQQGVSVRIRRIPLPEIKPGSVVDGPVIFEADTRYQIDNLEAISVHRTRSGEIILTLVSDNNFSSIQRTLLLQFALKEK
jgi:hypothetical protein